MPVSDCDLTFWADLKSRDAQGNDRTPPHYLVAFGKQLRCFSEAKCRALLGEDQPASYLHAFDWIDGLWNGQLSKQPWHVEVCTALLERAFLKGLHACVHAKAAADEAAAADALEAAKQAVQKKFGEEKRFEMEADVKNDLEKKWQCALDHVNTFMNKSKDAVSWLPHVLRSLEATLGATLEATLEALPPIGVTLDMHLPRYSSPLFLEAIQRDARADLLGTHAAQQALWAEQQALWAAKVVALEAEMSRQRAGCLPVAPEATATSDAAEVVGSKRKQLAPPPAAEAAAPAGDA